MIYEFIAEAMQPSRWQGTYQMSSSDNVRKYAVRCFW
jgi:hypothetical protein